MARPLNKNVIKERIKSNKASMKDANKEVNDALTNATKGEAIDAVATRAALASFIKASKAFNADTTKLASIAD